MGVFWGVDSTKAANESLLACVKKNYGKPLFWGRYLSTVEGSVEGLTKEEILFLHNNRIRILPIFNTFRSSVGYKSGSTAAKNALYQVNKLKIPRRKVIFASIERSFDVDSPWIIGFFETIHTGGYKSGFYHDPIDGKFNEQFCEASRINHQLKYQSTLWSSNPEVGASKKDRIPTFKPETVDCESNTFGWQYGRDSNLCSVNTNLIKDTLYSNLY